MDGSSIVGKYYTDMGIRYIVHISGHRQHWEKMTKASWRQSQIQANSGNVNLGKSTDVLCLVISHYSVVQYLTQTEHHKSSSGRKQRIQLA